jgi:hypothetical protein
MFKKATKETIKIRLAISGASGSGKTYSALSIASCLGKSVALIDTENFSSNRYADIFDFSVCSLDNHHPARYVEAIKAAEAAGFDVIIIDSLSHAWFAELDLAGGRFDGWKNVRPLERKLIDAMLSSRCHVIATMRSKTEWVMEQSENKSGKSSMSPRKIGTAPIQSSGIEYEFDVTGDMDYNHILSISKTRCSLLDGKTFLNPGRELADILKGWMMSGSALEETVFQTPQNPRAAAPTDICKGWKSEADAIQWASGQLPGFPIEKIQEEFRTLQPENGKKALAWVKHVLENMVFQH